jgi:hypothetical protein
LGKEYKYRDIWRARIYSFVLGILVMGLILTFWPRQIDPPPDNPTVTENPSEKDRKSADAAFTRQESGTVTSYIEINPSKNSGAAGGAPGAENGSATHSPSDWDPGGNLKEQNLVLPVGGQWTAPAEINFKVNYFDSTGAPVGQSEQMAAGKTTVTAGQKELIITTDFTRSSDIAVTIPDPPKKLTAVGLNLAADFNGVYLGGFYQRDFILWPGNRWELVGYVRGEVMGRVIGARDPWVNLQVEAGISYRY